MNRINSTILKSVTKPGRYSGGEYGQIIKDKKGLKWQKKVGTATCISPQAEPVGIVVKKVTDTIF